MSEWTRLNKLAQARDEMILPMLEPGRYTACFGRDLSELLSHGVPLPANLRQRCESGDLAPYGELHLEIPREAMAAALAAGG